MKNKYLILDCYVDEPACFGVPPFISPYPRYIYGALVTAGIAPREISFLTIDSIRDIHYTIEGAFSMVFLIGGAVVPGKYLGHKIGSLAEIRRIIDTNHHLTFAVGGLISHIIKAGHDNIIKVRYDLEKFAYQVARGDPRDIPRENGEIKRWAVSGAKILKEHPEYPNLICEIETYRGCPRQSRCSFCSEGLFSRTEFRHPEDIINEIEALIAQGISRFRLGNQPDILEYMSPLSEWKHGFPRPDPRPVIDLFTELRKWKETGRIKLLSIDNANPGTIVAFPDESRLIIEAIASAVTPGDTMALGIESFDLQVIRQNNLKVSPEEALTAIRIINEAGSHRIDGIPALLPGVNLVHGLKGESEKSFEANYQWLRIIRDSELLLKRINIRKLNPIPGTPAYEWKKKVARSVRMRFEYYREKIRSDIDHTMLEKIYPVGTVIPDCMIVEGQGDSSYGRQLASYAITLKFPLPLQNKSFTQAVIVGHSERSLNALPIPIHLNSLPERALRQIPGIGRRRSEELILRRPFNELNETSAFTGDVDEGIKKWFIFREKSKDGL